MNVRIDCDCLTQGTSCSLEKIGVTAELSADKEKILAADGLILPGVGAYPTAMAELERRGLVAVIKEAVAQGVPLLGICLGMQILTEKGELPVRQPL